MPHAIITLITDFGTGSPYAAQMKGVMLGINPAAVLVDVTHDVPPQNVRYAALVLQEIAPRFPEHSIHVCVVDPGVGTTRKVVLVDVDRQRVIAPDNGLLSRLLGGRRPTRVIELNNAEYWLQPLSATFHGRDMMAPVAAHLSLGVSPERFGSPLDRLVTLPWPVPVCDGDQVRGVVLSVDSFGNLITNIDRDCLAGSDPGSWDVQCGGQKITGLVQTYGQRPAGSLVALFGSGGLLEVARVQGNAAQRLGAAVDQEVVVARRRL
jgi:S-adenosyl-L-methionine hydrolase (adenosine-forming)